MSDLTFTRRAPAREALETSPSLDLALLQRVCDYPAISLLVNVDGPDRTRVRLRQLARQAGQRLHAEFGANHPTIAWLLSELDDQVAAADLEGPHPALGVFVAPGLSAVRSISEPVVERVIIDETFATRDLVHAQLRSPHYYVLHLSESVTRLYEGRGSQLHEVGGRGLPVLRPGLGDPDLAPARRNRHESFRRRDQQLRRFVRAVDAGVEPHLRIERLPVFVVGGPQRVSAFRASSRHRALVEGAVSWGGRSASPAVIEELVRPEVDALLARRTEAALAELDAATGRGRVAHGLHDCWRHGRSGLGDLLVVERTYAVAARVDAVTDELHPTSDIEAPDVVDDVLDELIEHVLAQRGRVVIVPDGTLTDRGRVALTLRAAA